MEKKEGQKCHATVPLRGEYCGICIKGWARVRNTVLAFFAQRESVMTWTTLIVKLTN
jgi:hypothetical protein